MAKVALEFIDAAAGLQSPTGEPLAVRAGVHCGPIVGGVVGTLKPHWSPFGSTVAIASRMESSGEPGRVHVSASFAAVLASAAATGDAGDLRIVQRGSTSMKGLPDQSTFWLERGGSGEVLFKAAHTRASEGV